MLALHAVDPMHAWQFVLQSLNTFIACGSHQPAPKPKESANHVQLAELELQLELSTQLKHPLLQSPAPMKFIPDLKSHHPKLLKAFESVWNSQSVNELLQAFWASASVVTCAPLLFFDSHAQQVVSQLSFCVCWPIAISHHESEAIDPLKSMYDSVFHTPPNCSQLLWLPMSKKFPPPAPNIALALAWHWPVFEPLVSFTVLFDHLQGIYHGAPDRLLQMS